MRGCCCVYSRRSGQLIICSTTRLRYRTRRRTTSPCSWTARGQCHIHSVRRSSLYSPTRRSARLQTARRRKSVKSWRLRYDDASRLTTGSFARCEICEVWITQRPILSFFVLQGRHAAPMGCSLMWSTPLRRKCPKRTAAYRFATIVI